jgi:proliferating cell nuclear antigen
MSEEVAAGIIKAGRLQQYIDTLIALVDEAKIHFSDDGLTVSAVEPANVAMHHNTTLAARGFEHYETPGQAVVGVPLTRLDERLNTAGSDDLIEFTLDMETRKLHLEYRNVSQTLALIDQQSIRSEPDEPELDLDNEIVMEGRQFAEAVDVVELVSDHLKLEGLPEDRCVKIIGEGDTDDNIVTFSDDEAIDADVQSEKSSLYSTSYWESIADPMPSDSEVTVKFDDNHPVIIEYSAMDGALNVTAMVAPRISRN